MEFVGLCSAMAMMTTIQSLSQKQTQQTHTQDQSRTQAQNDIEIDTETIVTDIINNDIQLEKPNAQNILQFFSVDEKEEYSDQMKEIKNLCTRIVTDELLKSDDNTHLFLLHIVNTFEDAINIYCTQRNINKKNIIFLYKSGNILRMLNQHIMNYLPNYDVIRSEMANYFKKGD